ncbi:PA14 domain-containing protein [Candidatus Amarolinea dominans]|uniref:PA14 domain-containing protein n=1 Tax=Candidatus Amarolinea dominans TaxID=3140696 RepID=UPI003135FC1B|nr:hypothetical protein [Anaerolineae bacterium]
MTASYLECNVRIADLPVVQTPQPTVTANPIVAAIAIAPVQGWAGTSVSISGVNWTPGATVYVSLGAPNAGPTGDVYAQGAVGQDGRFGANFVFPAEDRWLALSQVIVVAHTQDYQRSANATFALSRPAPQITEWKGEYFNNRNLSGASVLVRNDSSVDFNWGSAAPAAGLPADNFSVRWTRTLRFDAGDYRFYARSDDGVRIWLDNWLVTDQWYDGGAGLRSGDFQGVGAGEHTVRIEYYEGQGDAFATIWWERTGPITEWKGEYFNNTNLDDVPVLVRNDSAINFNWGSDAPAAQIARDYFSARWTRKLSFEDGLYRFSVRADDGVRLWINGQPTIDQWHDSQSQTYTADVPPRGRTQHQARILRAQRRRHDRVQLETHRQPLAHPAADQPGAGRQRPIHRHRQQLAHHDQQPRRRDHSRRAHSRRDHHPWRERQQFRRQQQRPRGRRSEPAPANRARQRPERHRLSLRTGQGDDRQQRPPACHLPHPARRTRRRLSDRQQRQN